MRNSGISSWRHNVCVTNWAFLLIKWALTLVLFASSASVAEDSPLVDSLNMVKNPSFESGGTTPTSWNLGASAVGSTHSAQSGMSSLRLTTTTSQAATSQTIATQIGVTYDVSVWINTAGLTSGYLVFDTNDKYDDTCQFVVGGNSAGWTKYSGRFTATQTSLTLRTFSATTSFIGTAYVDNIFVTSIVDANNAPAADAQSVTTSEDVSQAITLAGSDVDGDVLSYSIVTQPTKGVLSGSAPNLIYTPATNYNGSDCFTFLVNDGAVNSSAATVSITVIPVNDAPVAYPQSVIAMQNMSTNIVLGGRDADGDPLTYSIIIQPKNGTLSGTGTNLIYTPAFNYSGSDIFTFSVNDNGVRRSYASVSIAVTPLPITNLVLNPSFELGGVDLTSWSRGATAIGSTSLAQSGLSSLQLTTTSSQAATSQTIATQVGVTYDVSVWINTKGLTSGYLVFDTDDKYDDTCQFVVGGNSAGWTKYSGSFTATRTSLTLRVFSATTSLVGAGYVDSIVVVPQPGPNLVVNPSFELGGTAPTSWSLGATAVGSTNSAQSGTSSLRLTTTGEASASIQDISVEPYSFYSISVWINGSGITGGIAVFDTNDQYDAPGQGQFVVSANSGWTKYTGTFYSTTDTLRLRMFTENFIGTVYFDNVVLTKLDSMPGTTYMTVVENTRLDLPPDYTFVPDEDFYTTPGYYHRTHTVVINGLIGVAVPNSYTPNPGVIGHDLIAIRENIDSEWLAGSEWNEALGQEEQIWHGYHTVFTNYYFITVTPNTAPEAYNQSVGTREDTAAAITLKGRDVDVGCVLEFSINTHPSHGALSGSTTNWVYTPDANYHGADSFTFVINDGTVNSASGVVSIQVDPVNDAPVANGQSVSTMQDKSTNIVLVGSDVDGTPLTYSIVTSTTQGVLSGTPPNMTYTPATNYAGTDSFTFRVYDGIVYSPNATVSVTVTNVPLPSPWQTQDIGLVGKAGSATYTNSAFRVVGAGSAVADTVDSVRYVHQLSSGNCDIKVNVLSLTNTMSGKAKSGVMIRESLNSNAREAGIWVTPTNGIVFTRRYGTGLATVSTVSAGKKAPYWVRLERTNNVFNAYYGTDGVTWTQFGSNTISMSTNAYIGMGVCSGATNTLATTVFTDVTATP